MSVIVIDPGHGGSADVGRSSWRGAADFSGTLEKNVTLRLAHRLKARLGAPAMLTRSGDVNLSLGDRAEVGRNAGADVFISLHASRPHAGEIWVHRDAGGGSSKLARTLTQSLHRYGYHGWTVGRGEFAVLSPRRLAPHTAACLLELPRSTEGGEREVTDAGLDRLTMSLAAGIREFFSHQAHHTFGGQRSDQAFRRRTFDRRAAGA